MGTTGVAVMLLTPSLHAKLSFFSDESTLYTDESAVIAFELDQKASEAKTWEASIEPAGLVDVIQPARALADQSLGYIRLLPRQPGLAILKLGNGASLQLNIKSSPPQPAKLLWISPLEGTALEGVVQVGLDLVLTNPRSQEWEKSTPVLQVGQGEKARTIRPSKVLTDRLPRSVRYIFDLNCNELEAGLQSLTADWQPEGGTKQSIQQQVYVLNALSTRQLDSYAAEDLTENRVTFVNREKPQPLPKIDDDETALGKKYAFFSNGGQTLAIKVNAAHAGHYQVFARARAPLAAGAYASMGVYLNDKDESITAARCLSGDWHRIPVGLPIYLEAGEHLCSLRFTNDFAARKNDRNLHIDQISILKIPDDAPIANHAARTLTVAFRDIFDGETIQGPFEIEGQADYDGMKKNQQTPPVVSLWINGEKVQTQVHPRPRFQISPHHLKTGSNQIQLQANHMGRTVASAIQTVQLAQPQDTIPFRKMGDLIFTSSDPAWKDPENRLQDLRHWKYSNPVFQFSKNGEVALNIPSELSGTYRVFLRAEADNFEGSPRAHLSLQVGETTTPLSDIEVPNYKEFEVGKIRLNPENPSQLHVAFTNELSKNKKQARRLSIHHIRLSPDISNTELPETDAPQVAIQYPPPAHQVWREDAIIAKVFDPSGIRTVTLLVDGERPLPSFHPPRHFGPVVMPLIAKELSAGEHRIALLVEDHWGNKTTTPAVPIQVLASPPEKAGAYHRSMHLLDRLAYGPEPAQLAQILIHGEAAWLDAALVKNTQTAAEVATTEIASFPRLPDNDYWVARKALSQAILSQNPVKERFNFWVQNHFSTWIRKAQGFQKWREHNAFHHAGFDRFNRLLNISAHSPAMLVYLDQQRSFAKRINENYAREIMELHTLSVEGRYNQQDVTTLSRVLTGWMTSEEAFPDGRKGNQKTHEFQFESTLNDPAAAEVIGLSLPEADTSETAYDRVNIILETLSRHPDTAHFISRKFAEQYVPLPAPDSLVAALETSFHRSGGDMQQLMKTLVAHQAFWDSMDDKKLATPLDYSIRIARIINHYDTGSYHGFLQRSGMGLFEKSTPDGYPQDPQAYADSNAMLQRWHLAKEIADPIYRHIDRAWRIGWQPDKNGMTLAELTAITITGSTLEEKSEQALQELIRTTEAKKLWSPGLCALMLQLPQTQYR